MTKYAGAISGNITIMEGDDVSALTKVSGSVDVREGASLTAPALVESGGVDVGEGASLTAPALVADIYYEISNSGYVLFANSEFYKAGCRGPFKADKALAHWDRKDVRAVDFTKAIKAHEAKKAAGSAA